MCTKAEALAQQGKALTPREWRFNFFLWWEEDDYEMDPVGVIIGDKDRLYFTEIEAAIGRPLSDRKRAWYVATRDADFAREDTARNIASRLGDLAQALQRRSAY